MHVTSLRLHNFRSFVDSETLEFDRINILIGENNSGKSSVLRALHLMQDGSAPPWPDVRLTVPQRPETAASITIGLEKTSDFRPWSIGEGVDSAVLSININAIGRLGGSISRVLRSSTTSSLPNREPDHFVIPYLSKRKTAAYNEDVRDSHSSQIVNDLTFLPAKLSRLSNSSFPGNVYYTRACKEILGFIVTAVPSEGGQRPGVYLADRRTLFIDQMGEGVPNIVGLLADLTLAEGKLFLIEEPENDLHPRALKALLELIVESSKLNQFVVSTHSNIVVRYLASEPTSRLFSITASKAEFPPTATVTQVAPTVEARLTVLRDLGYAFADFDLWDGWLILEESSAERLIRDYLIPWFVPKLTRVRTIAVGGTGNVEPTFEDFQRLVRFTHLEKAYQGVVWVRVDGDATGKSVVEKMQSRYPGWDSDRFSAYVQPNFEQYFPAEFADRSAEVLALPDRQAKRAAKKELLELVRVWLDKDEIRAKAALEISAAEVISDLRLIEAQLLRAAP